jgi:hypothetical protein
MHFSQSAIASLKKGDESLPIEFVIVCKVSSRAVTDSKRGSESWVTAAKLFWKTDLSEPNDGSKLMISSPARGKTDLRGGRKEKLNFEGHQNHLKMVECRNRF